MIFLSCNGQKKSVIKKSASKTQDSNTLLNLIVSDNYSGADSAETLLITDIKGLQKFYSKINRTRKPGLPVPDIDFSKESVIIRCSGKQNDSSPPELYVIEVSEESVVIGIKETIKNAKATAVTTPFSVYKIPLNKKEVIFKKEQ